MNRERIGKIFFKAGLISRDALAHVLEENRTHPQEKLGQTLVRLHLASDAEVARALSLQFDIPYIDLNMVVVDPYAVKKIPLNVAMKHHILPIYIEKNNLILAMEDPQDFEAIEAARFASSLNLRPHMKVDEQQLQDLKKQSESPAIVKMVNTIVFQGIADQRICGGNG